MEHQDKPAWEEPWWMSHEEALDWWEKRGDTEWSPEGSLPLDFALSRFERGGLDDRVDLARLCENADMQVACFEDLIADGRAADVAVMLSSGRSTRELRKLVMATSENEGVERELALVDSARESAVLRKSVVRSWISERGEFSGEEVVSCVGLFLDGSGVSFEEQSELFSLLGRNNHWEVARVLATASFLGVEDVWGGWGERALGIRNNPDGLGMRGEGATWEWIARLAWSMARAGRLIEGELADYMLTRPGNIKEQFQWRIGGRRVGRGWVEAPFDDFTLEGVLRECDDRAFRTDSGGVAWLLGCPMGGRELSLFLDTTWREGSEVSEGVYEHLSAVDLRRALWDMRVPLHGALSRTGWGDSLLGWWLDHCRMGRDMILPLMEQDRQITFGEVFAMDAALSGLETGPVIS